jgi:hypothetical protein
MKTIKTNYGHMKTESSYKIGIRTYKNANGTQAYYTHVHFPTAGTNKRSNATFSDENEAKKFTNSCISYSKKNNFPLQNQHGQYQFVDFDPTAPSAV